MRLPSSIRIEAKREMIDVSTRGRHVPDPDWSHSDSCGHVHRFADNDLPTLEYVVTGVYWCETCMDEHEEGEWRCRACGEAVEPRYKLTGPEHRSIPGLLESTLWVDDRPLSLSAGEYESLLGLEGDALLERATEIISVKEAATAQEP